MTHRLRILSYNIHKAVGLDGRRDPERIQQVIRDSGADIVILQEADRRLGARPSALPRNALEAETPYRVAHVAATEVSLGWHGNAVLVHRDLAVVSTERLPLPGLEPRGSVRVDIDAGALGQVTVVGAHLALMRHWRRRQMRAIRDHLTPQERVRTIIAGDFNEWSLTSGFEPLGRAFEIHTPGRSFHASYPVAALDRFALGEGFALKASGVIQTGAARRASDHLPVWAEVGSAQAAPTRALIKP